MSAQTMTEMMDEIWANVLPELAANGIEDTPTHRLWALEGLLAGWMEEDADTPEAQPWINTLKFNITLLKLKTFNFNS